MDDVTMIRLVAGLIGLALPLICAIFVGIDASKRGMSGIGWGIGVFLLCIVFLPIYLIVRKPLLPQPGQMLYAPGQMVNQHNVGQQYGYPSGPGMTQPPAAPIQQGSGYPVHHFCANCGTQLASGARFCPSCGSAA